MASSLVFSRVSFTYDTLSSPLFSDFDLTFSPGWTALTGVNGCGKSTLLSLATGSLRPELGTVSGNQSVATLAQDMERAPSFFDDPSLVTGGEAFALLGRLGIGDDWPWRWDSLSGGEKRRALVADVLFRKPSVLILDEPTNHLDESTLGVIAAALTSFKGTGIVVSHNLAFLDVLCSKTVILHRGPRGVRARTYHTSPSSAFGADRDSDESLRARRNALAHDLDRLAARRAQAAAEVARSRVRLSKRGLDPKDHDAKGRVNGARVSGKDAGVGSQEAKWARQVTRKATELDALDAPGRRKVGATFQGQRVRSDSLARLEPGILVVAAGELTIEHPELVLGSAARIGITGHNGTGKTSLLSAFLPLLHTSAARVVSLGQEPSWEERKSLLEQVRALDSATRGEVISIVYRLGSEPASILEAAVASPGETKKLAMAFAMVQGAACLVLDEPTNHLDALSASLLAEALAEFPGALIMVSHDHRFLELVGCERWHLTRRQDTTRLRIVPGGGEVKPR